jgi:ATP-binding protein involved in chromosome partitioning
LTGAVVVTTPQKVAIADVMKSISMFKNNSIEVPVLGIVENMSYFTPSDMPNKKYYIFGKDGGENLAKRFNVPLLGQIPIDENVVSNADNGIPAIQNTSISEAFVQLATRVVEQVEIRNKNLPPTKILKIN